MIRPQVIPDSPVHVPIYPSPQKHVQPSAPGEISDFKLNVKTFS